MCPGDGCFSAGFSSRTSLALVARTVFQVHADLIPRTSPFRGRLDGIRNQLRERINLISAIVPTSSNFLTGEYLQHFWVETPLPIVGDFRNYEHMELWMVIAVIAMLGVAVNDTRIR